ncbi:hypothetical protein HMI50_44870 [Corallococcus carmarthensis]|nr:hypothetical protein [Corallococcus carmarthensis]
MEVLELGFVQGRKAFTSLQDPNVRSATNGRDPACESLHARLGIDKQFHQLNRVLRGQVPKIDVSLMCIPRQRRLNVFSYVKRKIWWQRNPSSRKCF